MINSLATGSGPQRHAPCWIHSLQRVLMVLGVESISAHSPEAKGRIERLWGTLQQRLVKEMRLSAISTLEAANGFLPAFIARFNARFAIEAADSENSRRLISRRR